MVVERNRANTSDLHDGRILRQQALTCPMSLLCLQDFSLTRTHGKPRNCIRVVWNQTRGEEESLLSNPPPDTRNAGPVGNILFRTTGSCQSRGDMPGMQLRAVWPVGWSPCAGDFAR